MGKCASGLDLSHLWNYDQPFSRGCRLIVSSVLLVQHCPLTLLFFYVYLFRPRWCTGDVRAL